MRRRICRSSNRYLTETFLCRITRPIVFRTQPSQPNHSKPPSSAQGTQCQSSGVEPLCPAGPARPVSVPSASSPFSPLLPSNPFSEGSPSSSRSIFSSPLNPSSASDPSTLVRPLHPVVSGSPGHRSMPSHGAKARSAAASVGRITVIRQRHFSVE